MALQLGTATKRRRWHSWRETEKRREEKDEERDRERKIEREKHMLRRH